MAAEDMAHMEMDGERRIYCHDSLPSTFEKAFELISLGKMSIWDSVIARCQTEGRGQLRRSWYSPPGNIYASLRLPLEYPFNASGASVVLGMLCARALREAGWQVMLKWPNDLIIIHDCIPKKVGGILLEERGFNLVAGIGINLAIAPGELREGAALPAGSLGEQDTEKLPDNPLELWKAIVKSIFMDYTNTPSILRNWRKYAENLLLWRGLRVEITEGGKCHAGILAGLARSGDLVLRTARGRMEFQSGSLHLPGPYIHSPLSENSSYQDGKWE